MQQDKGILYSKRISHLHSLCIATQVPAFETCLQRNNFGIQLSTTSNFFRALKGFGLQNTIICSTDSSFVTPYLGITKSVIHLYLTITMIDRSNTAHVEVQIFDTFPLIDFQFNASTIITRLTGEEQLTPQD